MERGIWIFTSERWTYFWLGEKGSLPSFASLSGEPKRMYLDSGEIAHSD